MQDEEAEPAGIAGDPGLVGALATDGTAVSSGEEMQDGLPGLLPGKHLLDTLSSLIKLCSQTECQTSR